MNVTELLRRFIAIIALVHSIVIAGYSCLHLARDWNLGIDVDLSLTNGVFVESLIFLVFESINTQLCLVFDYLRELLIQDCASTLSI